MRQVYLDHNATTPLHPEVLEAFLLSARETFGNPSSIHWAGRNARSTIEKARESVVRLVNCDPVEVIFTSSGTEADNAALKGIASAAKGDHIVTTAVEHPAVLNTCLWLESRGVSVTRVPVDRFGMPDPAEVEAAINPRTMLVSVMLANNETGNILPVAEIGSIAERHRIPLHCDAVQAAGRIPVDLREMKIGLLSLSAHKMYAPKGVGALVVRKGIKLHPLLHGGSQERNRRAGTENVAGIAAFGAACELAIRTMEEEAARQLVLRRRLEEGILGSVPGTKIQGHPDLRLPNTATISFSGIAADSLILNLDLKGIAVSSGAACSSGTLRHSPVLAAMGVSPEEAGASIRFSLGRTNTAEEIDYLLEVLPETVERLRSRSGS
jgi:cysteine desulfurase